MDIPNPNMPEDHTTYATVTREHCFRGTDAAGRNRRSTGLDDGTIDGALVAPILRRDFGCAPLDPTNRNRATRFAAVESLLRGSEPEASRES